MGQKCNRLLQKLHYWTVPNHFVQNAFFLKLISRFVPVCWRASLVPFALSDAIYGLRQTFPSAGFLLGHMANYLESHYYCIFFAEAEVLRYYWMESSSKEIKIFVMGRFCICFAAGPVSLWKLAKSRVHLSCKKAHCSKVRIKSSMRIFSAFCKVECVCIKRDSLSLFSMCY